MKLQQKVLIPVHETFWRKDRYIRKQFTVTRKDICLKAINLDSVEGVETSKFLIYASIVVEIVYLVVSLGGNLFSFNDARFSEVIKAASLKAINIIAGNEKAQEEIKRLKESWLKEELSKIKNAEAIFKLIKAIGILKIVHYLLEKK